jgi:hypothetical protein
MPSRVQTPHAHAACCTLHRMRVVGILWKSLVVGRAVASARSTDAGRRSPSPTRRHSTEAGQRATLRGRARRSRAYGTTSGPAADHCDQAQPPAPAAPALGASPSRTRSAHEGYSQGQAGKRPRRGRVRRSRADGTISGPCSLPPRLGAASSPRRARLQSAAEPHPLPHHFTLFRK